MFLIAGFDTTYTAMNNCFHTLTAHPEEMKKLQDEIDSVLNDVKSNKFFYVDYKNIFYLCINFIKGWRIYVWKYFKIKILGYVCKRGT